MRALVFPQFGLGIAGYAPWEVSKYLVQAEAELASIPGDKWWFDVILPKPDRTYWKYDPAPFVAMLPKENSRVHFCTMFNSAIDGCSILTADHAALLLPDAGVLTHELHALFNQVKGENRFYDCVITHAPMLSPLLKKTMKPKFQRFGAPVTIVNVPPFVRTLDRKRMAAIGYGGEDEVIADLIGCLNDVTIVYNQSELDLLLDVAKKYLSPPMALRLQENTLVEFFGGIDCTKLDDVYKRRIASPVGDPCLFWGGRMVEQKRWNEWLKLAAFVHGMRPNVKVVACTQEDVPEAELARLRAEYPFVDFRTKVGKEQYQEYLLEGHVFMNLSLISATGYLEQAMSGQIGVHIRNPYVRDQVPPDWPFVADTEKEVAQLAVWCLDHFAEKLDQIEEARTWLRDKYERRGSVGRTLAWIKKKIDARRNSKELSGAHGSIAGLVVQAAKSLPEPFKWSDLMEACTKLGTSDRPWGRRGDQISAAYLRQLVLANDYLDLCEGPEPTFLSKATLEKNATALFKDVMGAKP